MCREALEAKGQRPAEGNYGNAIWLLVPLCTYLTGSYSCILMQLEAQGSAQRVRVPVACYAEKPWGLIVGWLCVCGCVCVYLGFRDTPIVGHNSLYKRISESEIRHVQHHLESVHVL